MSKQSKIRTRRTPNQLFLTNLTNATTRSRTDELLRETQLPEPNKLHSGWIKREERTSSSPQFTNSRSRGADPLPRRSKAVAPYPSSHFTPAWARPGTESDASTSQREGTRRAKPWCSAPERCASDHCSNPLAVPAHPASEARHGEDEPQVGYSYLTPG